MDKVNQDAVENRAEPIEQAHWEALKKATASDHVQGMPPTFPTVYRNTEFEWLKRMGVHLRDLLHAEQVYEYLGPLPLGTAPTVRTFLKNKRERGGMAFITLETEIRDGEKVVIRANTMFVIRQGRGQE